MPKVLQQVTDRMAPLTECPACLSTRLRSKRVRSAYWNGHRLVLVDGVPALVCADCGEKIFDEVAAQALDDLKCGGFPAAKAARYLQVPVFEYPGPRRPPRGKRRI